jgi:predicted RNase H-like HicB family nuclease
MEAELRYRVLISWSDEDEAFVAVVPELPGCAADGRTFQEAAAKAEVVMRQ